MKRYSFYIMVSCLLLFFLYPVPKVHANEELETIVDNLLMDMEPELKDAISTTVGETAAQTGKELLKGEPDIYRAVTWGETLFEEEKEETVNMSLGEIMQKHFGATTIISKKASKTIGDGVINKEKELLQTYFNDKRVGTIMDLQNTITDFSNVYLNVGEILVENEVDASLQLYEQLLSVATPLVELTGLALGDTDLANKVGAPLFVLDGLSGAWGSLRETPEYKDWVSQFETKSEFSKGFWEMTWDGLVYCMSDLPRELGLEWLFPPKEKTIHFEMDDEIPGIKLSILTEVKDADGNITYEMVDHQLPPSHSVPVYKPNIYLYSPQPINANVTFECEELLLETIPVYQNSWEVHVCGDGKLLWNQQEFEFLFYESLTDKNLCQYKTGWYIPAEDREAALLTVLEAYGFNEQETNDFMEFWMEKLEADQNYMMYPQDTELVDIQMPIKITPQPDKIRRLWFGFEAVDKVKTEIVLPQVNPIERDGFSVVEWGGFLL